MSSFYGKASVIRTHGKQPKKRDVSHYRRTSGDTFATAVTFSSYMYPVNEATGLGAGGGSPTASTTIVLYRLGQTNGVSVEDTIVDSDGETWLINSVNTRLDDDIDDGYCVYDCTVSRMA